MTDAQIEAAAAELMRAGLNAPEQVIYRAARAALEAAERAAWMPIETAPKDGTPFDAETNNGDIIRSVYWHNFRTFNGIDGAWAHWWFDGSTMGHSRVGMKLIRFRPLPQPPGEEAAR